MNDIEKKRVGFARKKARVILDQYFKHKPPIIIPIPVDKIAEYYGFEIYELDDLDKNHRGMIVEIKEEKRKLIGINKSYHNNAKRFSIGHELAHYFLEHPVEDDCTKEEIDVYNREAEEFSAELLMPLDLIKTEVEKHKGNLESFAKALEVSKEALYYKLQNQKLLNEFLEL